MLTFPYGPELAVCVTRQGRFQAYLLGRKPIHKEGEKGEYRRYLILSCQPRRGFATKEEAINAALIAQSAPELLESDFRRAQEADCLGDVIGWERFICSLPIPLYVPSTDNLPPKKAVPYGQAITAKQARALLAIVISMQQGKQAQRRDAFKNWAFYRKRQEREPRREETFRCCGKDHRIAITKGRLQLLDHTAEQIGTHFISKALMANDDPKKKRAHSRRCIELLARFRRNIKGEVKSREKKDFFPYFVQVHLRQADNIQRSRSGIRNFNHDRLVARPDRIEQYAGLIFQILDQAQKVKRKGRPVREGVPAVEFLGNMGWMRYSIMRTFDEGDTAISHWFKEVFLKGYTVCHGRLVIRIHHFDSDGTMHADVMKSDAYEAERVYITDSGIHYPKGE